MLAQESNRSSGFNAEESGLVPYCTKFYASRSSSELPGWRQPRPPQDLGISLTVKLPSMATSKAQVNTSPRYPRSNSPQHNTSVPVLPKVRSSRALMKVPLTATNRLELSTTDLRPDSERVRLPALRVYHDKSVSHHLHTSLTYSDLAISNVVETPERILRRELVDTRKGTEGEKRILSNETPRADSWRLPISQNLALMVATQADFSDASLVEDNRVFEDVRMLSEPDSGQPDVQGNSLGTSDIHLTKAGTERSRVIPRIHVLSDPATSLDSSHFPFSVTSPHSIPDSQLDFSPIHALPRFGLASLSQNTGLPCTDPETEVGSRTQVKDEMALEHMSEISSEGDSNLFPELIENSFGKDQSQSREQGGLYPELGAVKRRNGKKTDISLGEIRQEGDRMAIPRAVFLPQISTFPELSGNSDLEANCSRDEKDLESSPLASGDPHPQSISTAEQPHFNRPRKPTFSQVAADIIGKRTDLSESIGPQSPKVYQLSVSEPTSNSELSKKQKRREITLKDSPEHSETREFPGGSPKIIIERSDDSNLSGIDESLENQEFEVRESLQMQGETDSRVPPHQTEEGELYNSFHLDSDTTGKSEKQFIKRQTTMREGKTSSQNGKNQLTVPLKSKRKKGKSPGTKGYKKGGSKTPRMKSQNPLGVEALLRRLSIATDFRNLVIEEENPEDIIPTPGLSSEEAPNIEDNPLSTSPAAEIKVLDGIPRDQKHSVALSRRHSKVSNTASRRKGRNSVSNTSESLSSDHLSEHDPLQAFITNLSSSLLELINYMIIKNEEGEAAQEWNQVEEEVSAESMKGVGSSKSQFPEELKAPGLAMKRYASNPSKAKVVVSSPVVDVRKQQRARSLIRKSSSKTVKASLDSFSTERLAVPSPPESEDAVSSANEEEEGEPVFLEEEHELHKIRKHQDQIAAFELRHLSMMRKIAEDLMRGTEDQPQMDIPTLPTEEDQREKDRQTPDSATQNRAKRGTGSDTGSDTELHHEDDSHVVETVHFQSFDEKLGPAVLQSLDTMFQGYRPADISLFTPAVSLNFSSRAPKLVIDTRQIPEKVEIDVENYKANQQRRKFRNKMELQPDYGIFLEMQDGVLVQTENSKPDPRELRKYYRNCFLKRKKKEELKVDRSEQEHVVLYAQPIQTFSNLNAKKIIYPSKQKGKKSSISKIGISATDRRYSKDERVYFRLKQQRGIESFLKLSKPVDVSTVSRTLDELSQVTLSLR